MTRRDLRPLVSLFFLTALLLLPFLHRPLFVDDHAHFRQALEYGQRHQRMYREGSASLGWARGGAPGEANGPIYFHLFGWVTAHIGGELWKSHLIMGLITLCGLFALYGLAQEYGTYPVWAAFLWLSSPHAWLTADSLLVDALLGPICLVGLWGWNRGWRRKNPFWLALGASALAAAPLVKYTGLLSWLAAAAATALESREKRTWRWCWFILPVAVFVWWIWLSRRVYGASHFWAVAQAKITWPTLPHFLLVLVFAAATTPACWLVAAAGLADRKRRWTGAAILLACLAVGASFTPHLWGLQIGFWLGLFACWLIYVTQAWSRQDSGLAAWAAIGLLGLVIAIPWICARYLVIAGPAIVLLSVKALERLAPEWIHSPRRRWGAAITLALFSGLIAQADLKQAQADYDGAQWSQTQLRQAWTKAQGYYPGATLGGLGYALDQYNWQPLAPGASVPPGGVLALSLRTLPPVFWPSLANMHVARRTDFRSWNPVRVFDLPSGAGFYGSIWAPLPYTFSREPIGTYVLLLSPEG